MTFNTHLLETTITMSLISSKVGDFEQTQPEKGMSPIYPDRTIHKLNENTQSKALKDMKLFSLRACFFYNNAYGMQEYNCSK